ncbi:MAG: O-antigen ligase family protein [Pseudomonadota bacterium]
MIKIVDRNQAMAGALVFLFPFLCLITLFGVSVSSFSFLIAALFIARDGVSAIERNWRALRWVLAAFLFNFLFALACLWLREGVRLGSLEKPSRMLFSFTALMLVLVCKPDRRTLWWGVVGGALAGALLVGYQRLGLAQERPGGLINAITFGDLSLCLGLVSIAAALDLRHTRLALWPAVGLLAGLAGSIMTGTRGGWLALVMAALVLIKYSHVLHSRRVRLLVVASFALVAATYFVPDLGVHDRVVQGVFDVTSYFGGGSAFTNVGIRLELWKAAMLLIAEHPLLGVDFETARATMAAWVAAGRLDPVVLPMPHMHNDALQALVTGGVVGFSAWLSTLAAPFVFFARLLAPRAQANKPQFALALAGMLVVAGYFSFGLTEVIFWSVKGSLFYALMIFLLMGLCLNAKETDGK